MASTHKKCILLPRVWKFSHGFVQWRESVNHDNIHPTSPYVETGGGVRQISSGAAEITTTYRGVEKCATYGAPFTKINYTCLIS